MGTLIEFDFHFIWKPSSHRKLAIAEDLVTEIKLIDVEETNFTKIEENTFGASEEVALSRAFVCIS